MLRYLVPNLEIQEDYQKEPRFKGVCSKSNLPKIPKDGIYAIQKIYENTTAVTHNFLP